MNQDSLAREIKSIISRREARRPYNSNSLDISEPSTLEERLVSSLIGDEKTDKRNVRLLVNNENTSVVDDSTSSSLYTRTTDEAFTQMLEALKEDQSDKRNIQTQIASSALKVSQQNMRLGMLATSVAFVVVVFGVMAVFLGQTTVGLLTSSIGALSQVLSLWFFQHVRTSNRRLDKRLAELVELERNFRAYAMSIQLPDGELKESLQETIIMKILESDTSIRVKKFGDANDDNR